MNTTHKLNNISDVDIVEKGYFKKTITMSFDLSYSIYEKDKRRFEKDITDYMNMKINNCDNICKLTNYNYNSYSQVKIQITCKDDKEDLNYLLGDLEFIINLIFLKNDYY